MRRYPLLRLVFALSIASGVATACLYEVPDVVPAFEGGLGGDVVIPDQLVPDTRIDTFVPDTGVDAGACTLRCISTTVANRPNQRASAMAIDRTTSTAYIALEGTPTSNIASLALDGTTKPLTNLVTAGIAGAIPAVTTVTPGNELYFLNGGSLKAVDVATNAVVPFAGGEGGTIAATGLASELDVTNQQVFVSQSSPLRVARVSYVDGTATLVDNLASASPRSPAFFNTGVYWFDGTGTLAQLRRAPAAGGVTASGSSFLPLFGNNQSEGIFATSSSIVSMVANTVTTQSTIVNLTVSPRLIAIPGTGAVVLPAWVESTSPGVVKMLTPTGTTSATTVPNPEIPGGQLSIAHLFFSGTQLYAIGNTTTSTYVVYLHD